MLDTPSQLIAKMVMRKVRLRTHSYHSGQAFCSEIVQCMEGDVANLWEIEGIDFSVNNQDLVEYVKHNWYP